MREREREEDCREACKNFPTHSQPTIPSNSLAGNEHGSPVPGRAGRAGRAGQAEAGGPFLRGP